MLNLTKLKKKKNDKENKEIKVEKNSKKISDKYYSITSLNKGRVGVRTMKYVERVSHLERRCGRGNYGATKVVNSYVLFNFIKIWLTTFLIILD